MKTKRAAASSRRERLVVKSDADIRRYVKSPKLERDSKRLEAHLRKHGGDPSREDLKEMPSLSRTELARMYRPVKQSVHVRIDADVIAWLKSKDGPYQTRMNRILRNVMLKDR